MIRSPRKSKISYGLSTRLKPLLLKELRIASPTSFLSPIGNSILRAPK